MKTGSAKVSLLLSVLKSGAYQTDILPADAGGRERLCMNSAARLGGAEASEALACEQLFQKKGYGLHRGDGQVLSRTCLNSE